jgi:hypothetical protein
LLIKNKRQNILFEQWQNTKKRQELKIISSFRTKKLKIGEAA